MLDMFVLLFVISMNKFDHDPQPHYHFLSDFLDATGSRCKPALATSGKLDGVGKLNPVIASGVIRGTSR